MPHKSRLVCDCKSIILKGQVHTWAEVVCCCAAAPAGTGAAVTQAVPAQAAPASGSHRASSGTIAGEAA